MQYEKEQMELQSQFSPETTGIVKVKQYMPPPPREKKNANATDQSFGRVSFADDFGFNNDI